MSNKHIFYFTEAIEKLPQEKKDLLKMYVFILHNCINTSSPWAICPGTDKLLLMLHP